MGQAGRYAFLAGIVLAGLAGFVTLDWIWWVLALLGVVVGLLNITAEETRAFLIAAIALVLSASSIRQLPYIGETITSILGNLVVFISPAMLVVAVKSLFETAKDGMPVGRS